MYSKELKRFIVVVTRIHQVIEKVGEIGRAHV